jgi:exopolysaccharide biosynthesis WecB/TagA/CpsF family protein
MRDLGKFNVLGVLVSAVDREAAIHGVVAAARSRAPFRVTALAVHGVMTGNRDRIQRSRLNAFDLVVPDGQPVRWALNAMYRTRLAAPVRGTDLTLGVLDAAEREGLSVFFYGSRPETLEKVVEHALTVHPALDVAGVMPSSFRPVDTQGQNAIADRVRQSGADIVLVGLGCPRQETFVHEMSPRIGVPMLAVGAAFDYLAGSLRQPPSFVMRWGAEWAWRLLLEPRRLWRRYVFLNPAYALLATLQAVGVYRPVVAGGSAAGVDLLEA